MKKSRREPRFFLSDKDWGGNKIDNTIKQTLTLFRADQKSQGRLLSILK